MFVLSFIIVAWSMVLMTYLVGNIVQTLTEGTSNDT